MVEKNKENKKKYGVTYQRTRIMVPCDENPRRGICDGCGRRKSTGEIKVTQLHHWLYKYRLSTVKKNPRLALDNTNEFCFNPCHKAADSLRVLTAEINPKNYGNIVNVAKLMPEWMQNRFTQLCKRWIKENGK